LLCVILEIDPECETAVLYGEHVGIPLTNMRNCGPSPGFQTVPTDDPTVKEAAEHALKKLQQSSNSLTAYELSEIVSARAEVDSSLHFFSALVRVTIQLFMDTVWCVAS
jgi:hypothetical protein